MGMRSRKMLRAKYASQKEEMLRDLETSHLLHSFNKVRQNVARERTKAELMGWRRILNSRRRIILRWKTFINQKCDRQKCARRAIIAMLKAKLAAAFRTWHACAADQKRQQYMLGFLI